MANPGARYLELIGSCKFNTAGSSDAPNGFRTGIVSSTSRSGAGVYAVNLQEGADTQECIFQASVIGGAGDANVQVALTSDILLAVTAFVGAVATDEIVQLLIFKVRVTN